MEEFKGIILIILAVCLPLMPVYDVNASDEISTEADIIVSKNISMEIKEKGGRYIIKSEYDIQKILNSNRSLEDDFSTIGESYVGDISKINAKHNGKKIKSKFEVYPSPADAFFSTYKLHVISYPYDIKVGDTINYTYREEIEEITYVPIYKLYNDEYTEFFKLSVRHDQNLTVEFDLLFSHDPLDYEIQHPSPDLSVLLFQNIPERKTLPFYQESNWQATIAIKISANDSLITASTPQKFTEWYKSLTPLSPELLVNDKQFMQDELAQYTSVREKLQHINNYVKSTYRYVQDLRPSHLITPFTPSEILHSGYGDCKDRACLVSAIAKEAGMNVFMATVSEDLFIDYPYTHPYLYNHVICYYEDETEQIFFDPTDKYQSFNNIPDYLDQKQALILDPENPRTVILESRLEEPSFEIFIKGNLDSLSDCNAVLTVRERIKSIIQSSKETFTSYQYTNFLNDFISSYFYKMTISQLEELENNDEEIKFTAHVDLSTFIIAGKSKKYVPGIPFTLFSSDILKRENDSLALLFDKKIKVNLRIQLKTDSLEVVPDSLVLPTSHFVHFSSTADNHSADSALFEYSYARSAKKLEGDEKFRFIQFSREYINSKNKMYQIK
ncbi:MAG: transglutaminase family protein [Calditrichaeota bacterium]|nr:MAG: transglutaminase family protein [Calditrichota bacterium]